MVTLKERVISTYIRSIYIEHVSTSQILHFKAMILAAFATVNAVAAEIANADIDVTKTVDRRALELAKMEKIKTGNDGAAFIEM